MHDDGGATTPLAPVVTAARLGEMWPAVWTTVTGALMARGVSPAAAEDAVADAAVSCLTHRVLAHDAADLCRWMFRVADNARIDALRRTRRLDLRPDVVAACASPDPAAVAEQRHDVAATLRALRTLPDADVDALLADQRGLPHDDQVRAAGRRRRARHKLVRLAAVAP